MICDRPNTLPVPRLFHVADFADLDNIRKHGLLPRLLTGKPANDEIPSFARHVYLSADAGIPQKFRRLGAKFVVLEIEPAFLESELLYPDEDYLFQLGFDEGYSIDASQQWHLQPILEQNKDRYLESLREFGCIAYRGIILPAAIVKFTLLRCTKGFLWDGVDVIDAEFEAIAAHGTILPKERNGQAVA